MPRDPLSTPPPLDVLELARNRLREVKRATLSSEARIALAPTTEEISRYHELIGQQYQLEWVIESLCEVVYKQGDLGLGL